MARRPLICVLNRVLDVDIMASSFPMFEWFAIEEQSFYDRLNAYDLEFHEKYNGLELLIPDLFIEGSLKKKRRLPKFIQARFFTIRNMDDFQNQRMHIQYLLSNMKPCVYYRVTTDVKVIRKHGPSPRRFLEMHTRHGKTLNRIPHFWFDFSLNDPYIHRVFSTFGATISELHALVRIYHNTMSAPLDTNKLIDWGHLEQLCFAPFLFPVSPL